MRSHFTRSQVVFSSIHALLEVTRQLAFGIRIQRFVLDNDVRS